MSEVSFAHGELVAETWARTVHDRAGTTLPHGEEKKPSGFIRTSVLGGTPRNGVGHRTSRTTLECLGPGDEYPRSSRIAAQLAERAYRAADPLGMIGDFPLSLSAAGANFTVWNAEAVSEPVLVGVNDNQQAMITFMVNIYWSDDAEDPA